MIIPSRIRIKGKFIDIVYQDGLVEGKHDALWNPTARIIIIRQDISDGRKWECFIHELLHAISDMYGIEMTEKQVEKMDGPLSKAMLDIFYRINH